MSPSLFCCDRQVCGDTPLGSLDSLLATSLTAALQSKYGIRELPVLRVLMAQSLEDLNVMVKKRLETEQKAGFTMSKTMSTDPAYGLGSFRWWNGVRKRWSCPCEWLFRIENAAPDGSKREIDLAQLRVALAGLITRHPVLRALDL